MCIHGGWCSMNFLEGFWLRPPQPERSPTVTATRWGIPKTKTGNPKQTPHSEHCFVNVFVVKVLCLHVGLYLSRWDVLPLWRRDVWDGLPLWHPTITHTWTSFRIVERKQQANCLRTLSFMAHLCDSPSCSIYPHIHRISRDVTCPTPPIPQRRCITCMLPHPYPNASMWHAPTPP